MSKYRRTVNIDGINELQRQFKGIQDSVQGQEMQQTLHAAAKILETEVETQAPVAPRATQYRDRSNLPGALKESIRSASGRREKTFLQAFVFSLASLAPHAHLVEFGTKPHVIRSKGKGMHIARGAFSWLAKANKEQFRARVNHPGAKPNNFFRRSIAKTRSRIKRRITDGLNAILLKYGATRSA